MCPNWYRTVFSLPWYSVYTLNIDDLEMAVQRSFNLPRPPVSLSATVEQVGAPKVGPSRHRAEQREERVVQQFIYIFSGQLCPESVMIEEWLVKKSSLEIKQWNPR